MGREYYYKPGSFYRVDQRTGFAVRAERTRTEWNGLIVRDRSWEPRQPQDFVKGVRDDQTVPLALPRTPPTFVGPSQSTLAAFTQKGFRAVAVNTPFEFNIGDRLAIMLDADLGIEFFCVVTGATDFNTDFNLDFGSSFAGGQPDYSSDYNADFGPSSVTVVTFYPPLPGDVSSGNAIANLSVGAVTAASYGASNGG